jgi:glycosyltransferase involved in cell wall biosynthesis
VQQSGLTTPLISVIICTRNRAPLLRKALDSVVRQASSPDEVEIVVVDNGSTDETREVVTALRGRTNARYVYEAQIGLCVARNTGWKAARGRVLAYFDDDAIACPGWLSAIKHAFENDQSKIGVVGGRVSPLWEEARPAWLDDKIAGSLTIIDWGPRRKTIEDIRREWLVGANMALPKELLERVGGFHPFLDRVGKNLLSSGDVFLQKQVMRLGYECVYIPEMAIEHLVPASRLNRRWFIRRFFWQGISDAVMHLIENKPPWHRRLRLALSRSLSILRSRRKLSSLLLPARNPSAFSAKCFTLIEVGFISGLLGAARH